MMPGSRERPAGRVPVSGHYGLVGMRERAEGLGGTVQVTQPPGGGTCFVFTLPVEPPGNPT